MFFYYLHNLYVFVAKNIDRRLPSIKLVVSIMLYSMPFQSSLYKAPCCRTLWSWFIHLCIDIDRYRYGYGYRYILLTFNVEIKILDIIHLLHKYY